MNVVGIVGNLISQGVYSVATPFHPFGGAVDVIVVEQQDGTFRSTPWYVRFGKFQGVLKGAEKIVRVTVNGVEANFHMFLDNSGEAYFAREAELSGIKIECDNNVCDNSNPSGPNLDSNLSKKDDILHNNKDEDEKVENNEETYVLQEEHSTSEISVTSTKFTPYTYGNLDDVEDVVESSHNSNSEMVLLSIDGHVLTAPITANEEDTEDVQLDTPQFHLGPDDNSADDFVSDGNEWVAGTIDDINDSTPIASESCIFSGVSPNSMYHSTKTKVQSIPNFSKQISDDEYRCSPGLNRNDTFISCVEFSELSTDKDESDSQNLSSPDFVDMDQRVSEDDFQLNNPELHGSDLNNHNELCNGAHVTKFASISATTIRSHDSSVTVEEYESNVIVDVQIKRVNSDEVDEDLVNDAMQPRLSQIPSSDTETKPSDLSPVTEIERESNESASVNVEDIEHESLPRISGLSQHSNAQQKPEATEVSSTLVRPLDTEYGDEVSESQDQEEKMALGFEVSLCGNLLHTGMGNSAAAQAFDKHRISKEEFEASGQLIIKNKNLIVRFHGKYFRWDKAAPIVLGMAVFGTHLSFNPADALPIVQQIPKATDDSAGASPSGRGWRLWPYPFRRGKTLQSNGSSNVEDFTDIVSQRSRTESSHAGQPPRKQILRTNVPTTEEIASLNLKDGQNTITFSFCTMVLGKQQVDAHIYLWKWNARIVISDVDGTITKSDVLGQFMPLVGKDWSQSGVAPLFCAIKENGYQLLFLSARAIVQAYLTRSFLLNLKQDGKTLPSGPVVISPDGLFPSLYREVIRRAPHEFKIACLEDIKALFPSDYNPFYAGFGNRDTDELSYHKIGIPKGKIFIINPKGEVAINHRIDVKSYTSLHKLVNDMFPPTSIAEQEDYNTWNYWKVPLPSIDD